MKRFTVAMMFLAGTALAGCERGERSDGVNNQSVAERRADQVVDSADRAGERLRADADHAGDRLQAGAERTGDRIDAGAERLGDRMEEGADRAGAKLDAAGDRAERGLENAGNTAQRGVSDGWLTFKAASALYADTRVEGNKIDVDTQNGVVTLRGMVTNEAGKLAATRIVEAMDGVLRVDNQLSVVPRAREEAVEERDEQIKDRIDQLLDRDLYKEYDLNVDIVAGKVVLKGEVPNARAAYQVLSAVRNVPGVRAVDSQLQVKAPD